MRRCQKVACGEMTSNAPVPVDVAVRMFAPFAPHQHIQGNRYIEVFVVLCDKCKREVGI